MSTRVIRFVAAGVLLWGLSCVTHRLPAPAVVGNAASQTCPGKDGAQSASVTCRAGFTPECGCAADGHAECHCVAGK